VPNDVVRKVKAKMQVVDGFDEIWTSEGTGARAKVGFWRPHTKVSARKGNSVRVSVGDFAAPTFDDPKRGSKKDGGKRYMLELTDTSSNVSGSSITTGDWIEAVVDKFCPKPVRYKQVWSKLADGKPSLYCWKPVPVNASKYVALGVVFTTSDEPPEPEDLDCRTVPIKWVTRAKHAPKLVWEDSGTGGRPGSVWSVNTCNQITLAKGHDAPQEMFYDVRAERFFLRPEDVMSEKDAGYDKSLDRDSVIIEGWLMKKNQKGVEWWKKRYFVLKGHTLAYYLDETEAST
jgi:hypothetical protein